MPDGGSRSSPAPRFTRDPETTWRRFAARTIARLRAPRPLRYRFRPDSATTPDSGTRRLRAPGVAAWLLAAWCTAAGAEGPDATLERNSIRSNETVRLIIEAGDAGASGAPDLSPLERDFEVLGTSTSTQIQILNGRQSATTRWIVELAPRRSGELRVPPLRIDGRSTPALTLTVEEAPAAGGAPGDAIFLESEVFPAAPYVQSQVTYALRLFRAVEILDGTLEEPRAEGALVQRLGRDLGYSATRHGRRYRVIERRYAIFPQASGELHITPVRFDGEVAEAGSGGSSFGGLFARGRRVRIGTPEYRLQVRPRPPDYAGAAWLPARTLQLVERWSEEPPALRAGEPLTRTLTIEAAGLRGDQLPAIELTAPEGIKIYPDQPTIRTSSDAESVHGRREQRFALVPVREGEVTLPEIRVRWWDSVQDRPRDAVVPARRLRIAAAAADAAGLVAALDDASPARDAGASTVRAGGDGTRVWRWISAALLLLWAATGFGWWRSRRGPRGGRHEDPGVPSMARARRALGAACAGGDAGGARDALLAWAAAAWPEAPPRSLGALERGLGSALSAPLRELDRTLYTPGERAWEGGALWHAAKEGLRPPRSSRTRPAPPGLPELYPERRPESG